MYASSIARSLPVVPGALPSLPLATGRRPSLRRGALGGFVHFGPAQGEDQLGHDGDGDLLRALCTGVDADGRANARDFLAAEPGLREALLALGVIALRAEGSDVEGRRA